MLTIPDKGINFKVNDELYRKIKIKVATQGITIKDYIISLILNDFKKEN